MIFSVWTPDYTHRIGGVRVLWRFIELLSELGHEVYAFHTTTKPPESKAIVRKGPHPEGIVVLPDVAPPLDNRCVARWNLAYPGVWKNDARMKSKWNETVFHYNSHFAEASKRSAFNKTSHELYVGVLEPELFNDVKKIPKTVENKYFVGKGDQFGVRFGSTRVAPPPGAVPLARSSCRQEWINGIAEAKNLYVYDTVTAVTIEGHLAGCKVYEVNKNGDGWSCWSDRSDAPYECARCLKDDDRDLDAVRNLVEIMAKEHKKFGNFPKYISETQKIRSKILPYLTGNIMDIGCSGDVVKQGALAIPPQACLDLPSKYPEHIGTMNCVFSSHLLEHIRDDAKAVEEWSSFLKPGGVLILYLPDDDYYDNRSNPYHLHWYRHDDFIKRQFPNLTLIDSGIDAGYDKYSFYAVFRAE